MPDSILQRQYTQTRLTKLIRYKPRDPKQLRGDMEVIKYLARCNLKFMAKDPKDLLESPGLALTTDIWTSRNSDPYHSLIVHYINTDWELKKLIASVAPFSGRHTAENIAKKLNK